MDSSNRSIASMAGAKPSDALTGSAAGLALSALQTVVGARLSILMFHRVLPIVDPLFPDELDARAFDRRMSMVARAFHVISLESAIHHLKAGTLPHRSLVITFDDGYADNAEIALPILQRHGLTATFFVASGFLDGGIMWNDAVIEAIRLTRKPTLDLSFLGSGVWSLATPGERRAAIDEALSKIKYQSLEQRQDSIRTLLRSGDVDSLPADLMMRSSQVQALRAAGMSIGAHTVRHPILAKLGSEDARSEIQQGRKALESIIQAPVETLAYPNGKPGRDYLHEHVVMAREQGFIGAVTTSAGVARPGDDLFQLPRYTPWGTSSEVWAMRLLANQRKVRFPTLSPSRGEAVALA